MNRSALHVPAPIAPTAPTAPTTTTAPTTRVKAGACLIALCTAPYVLLAQVQTTNLAPRPTPPIPKGQEQLMGGHGVFMILFGVVLLAIVIGACLISPKRGHMD